MKKGNHTSMAVVPRRYSASVHCKEPGLARRVTDEHSLPPNRHPDSFTRFLNLVIIR
jgi:hypothetical protein